MLKLKTPNGTKCRMKKNADSDKRLKRKTLTEIKRHKEKFNIIFVHVGRL
jgi:hypothetical protein